MVCCMIGISLISSMCEGIYRCSTSHDCNGWFFICMICRKDEMFAGDGIFVIFPGNVYFWFINISKPPLPGVYGTIC